jgi:hypothetical protein
LADRVGKRGERVVVGNELFEPRRAADVRRQLREPSPAQVEAQAACWWLSV